jgi:hypothetical protein
MKFAISRSCIMEVERIEEVIAAWWRARAERARRFQWSVGEIDAQRLDAYASECEAEARRLERECDDAAA